jgi:hypothetical protein
MTSTDGGRKIDFNLVQLSNAPEAMYQHTENGANVTERRHRQSSKAELWICLTEEGIVIVVRQTHDENVNEFNCEREEGQSK